MTWPANVIRLCFYLLFSLVPLIFLPQTSELFEFNKMLLTYFLSLIIACCWASQMVLERRIIFKHTLLDFPLIFFLGTQFISLILSIDTRTSFLGYYGRWNGGLLSLICYSILYWAFTAYMDIKSAKTSLAVLVASASFIAIYGTLQHFGIDDHVWVQDVRSRVFSTIGQPNWLAAYLMCLIFIPVSFMTGKSPRTYLHLLIFSLLFACLLFTKSRSGLLAFAFSSGLYWILELKRKSDRPSLKIPILFASVTLIFTLLFPNPARDMLFKPTPNPPPQPDSINTGGTESTAIRAIVWKGAIKIWSFSLKNFLLGTGPETFAMSYFQHRPIEHNNTSEWEFLYNKAHNEFLNFLATTGSLGLASYLVLLIFMIKSFMPFANSSPQSRALLAGWASLQISNFWGFSVVVTQLLLFLLPAISQALTFAKPNQIKPKPATIFPKVLLACIIFTGLFLSFRLGQHWLADYHYAAAQKSMRLFSATEDPQHIISAYNSATSAYHLNPLEPVINLELAETAAYMAIMSSENSTSSAQFVDLSLAASQNAISTSPSHPSFYKSRSRIMILLSTLEKSFLDQAAADLAKAAALSPTDPRIPFNQALVAKYQNQPHKAMEFITHSLKLKPDFSDALKQLEEISAPTQ